MLRPDAAVIRFVVSALRATGPGSGNGDGPGRHIAAFENRLAVVFVIDEHPPAAGVVVQMVGLAQTGLADVAV